ncbi:MAG: response regulator [Cyanobacteria bacterium P01_E01_bin.48]
MHSDNDTRASQLEPAVLLEDMRSVQGNKYVDIVNEKASWQLYVERDKLVYASHSVGFVPQRLQHHFHVLGFTQAATACKAETQLRSRLELDTLTCGIMASDRVLTWLVSQRHLNAEQATQVVEALTREALESLLCADTVTFTLRQQALDLDTGCSLDVTEATIAVGKRLQSWRKFLPVVWSPYQRPRLSDPTDDVGSVSYKLSDAMRKRLEPILKGYTIRQLSTVLKQDELKIVQFLYPHILNNSIHIDDPLPPYDRLPKIDIKDVAAPAAPPVPTTTSRPFVAPRGPQATAARRNGAAAIATETQYKIACVDDSPTILTQIDRFLNASSDRFAITPITDSVKALVNIMRLKPDLILMDVGMPNINGYDLCRLLRNNRSFKETPIIMVTGNTATVDRMKARVVGATDFLAKPFTQAELVDMVTKHLKLAADRQRLSTFNQSEP